MADPMSRRTRGVPNAAVDSDTAMLLERVCAQLTNDYARQLVRDVVHLKLELGFDVEVRDYLRRKSGEYPAVRRVPRD